MKVYIRTAAGNKAALNPKSELPRKLRTLLISIDGRTRLNTYIASLSSFGDVAALIESLLQAGLIEAVEAQATAGDVWFESSPGNTRTGVGDTESRTAWSNTDVGSTRWRSPTTLNREPGIEPVDDLASWSKFQEPATPQAFKLPSVQPVTTAHYQLRNAIALMSDFVSAHMPMESLELVLTLEGLNSVEQIVASLKGYESLISHLGDPARRHMVELRNVLSSN